MAPSSLPENHEVGGIGPPRQVAVDCVRRFQHPQPEDLPTKELHAVAEFAFRADQGVRRRLLSTSAHSNSNTFPNAVSWPVPSVRAVLVALGVLFPHPPRPAPEAHLGLSGGECGMPRYVPSALKATASMASSGDDSPVPRFEGRPCPGPARCSPSSIPALPRTDRSGRGSISNRRNTPPRKRKRPPPWRLPAPAVIRSSSSLLDRVTG